MAGLFHIHYMQMTPLFLCSLEQPSWVAPFKSKRVWDLVVARFQKRLAGWKRHYLSKGARITDANGVAWSVTTAVAT